MRLRADHFDRHIKNMGQDMLWRRSYACACVSAETGSPDPKHLLCRGKGRIWDAPIKTLVGVPNQTTTAKMIMAGLWEQGDMTVTIPRSSPMWENAGRYDRVTMLNSTDVFSVPLTRGAVTEKLPFKPATITRVFWLDPTTRLTIDGVFPSVSDDGVITWGAGLTPPAGAVYSMTGTKYSEYYFFDQFPSDRNEHQGVQLPKKAQLRKWDLFGR